MMTLFPWFKKKELFSEEERKSILDAIRGAEQQTSGEIRVFVERRCRFVDPLDRAVELFTQLQMTLTKDRNAVLIYVAMKDHQLAILGDEGINSKVGLEYWRAEVLKMIKDFNRENYAKGIREVIEDIGEALHKHFPYDGKTDKNELPDDLIFGK